MDKIIIIDDEGKEVTYTNFQDFVEFADSFLVSFLPDNFSYRIDESDNHTDNLEQEILSALKINKDVNWIEHDANDEFDNLITFVKTLFSRYRGNN